MEQPAKKPPTKTHQRILRYGPTKNAKMNTERLEKTCNLIDKATSEGAFPGAVILIARKGIIATHRAYGKAVTTPSEKTRPMKLNTIFDLGSITKPIATATSSMMLLERGMLHLNDPINRFLPRFKSGDKKEVTIHHLLTHTSGLPAWKPLYQKCKTRNNFDTGSVGLPCVLGYDPSRCDFGISDVGPKDNDMKFASRHLTSTSGCNF